MKINTKKSNELNSIKKNSHKKLRQSQSKNEFKNLHKLSNLIISDESDLQNQIKIKKDYNSVLKQKISSSKIYISWALSSSKSSYKRGTSFFLRTLLQSSGNYLKKPITRPGWIIWLLGHNVRFKKDGIGMQGKK